MKTGALSAGVLGFFLATVAIYFDAWWHVTIGRDSFWIPPHVVLYSGIALSALGFVRQAIERWKERSPWEGPLKGWGLGILLIFVSAPFDELWHRIFGNESLNGVRILWSPPHLLLFGAMITVAVSLLLAMIRAQEKKQDGFLSPLALLAFAGISGILVLVLMPLSPVNFRILGVGGAFIFYYFWVIWRMAALEVLQRPVLTYLAAFHWFFLSFLILPDVMVERLAISQLLILVLAGVLAGAIGDIAFVVLRKVRKKTLYPLVGLIYMTADVLLVNPFFNLYLRTGHYEIDRVIRGHVSFDVASSLLMIVAGAVAGVWGGPQIGRWLSSFFYPQQEKIIQHGIGVVTGRFQTTLLMMVLVLTFSVTLITLSNPSVLEREGPRLSGRESPIGQIPASLELEKRRVWFYSFPSVWVSPDGQRVAYKAKKGKKWLMVVDGIEGKEYDWILHLGLPKFSPNGKRFMYPVSHDGKFLMVVDGKESIDYDGLYPAYTFSPDSQRTAFVAVRGKDPAKRKFIAVIDGIEGSEYDEISLYPDNFKPATYNNHSADGLHLMYATQADRWHGVTDGPDRTHDEISIGFSSDSQHFSYSAKRQGTWKVITDGVEKGDYEALVPFGALDQRLFFGPDGNRFAYAARRGGKWFAVIDGVEGPQYDFVEGLFGGRFSPDGHRTTYTAMRDGKWVVVIDGTEGKLYDRVSPPQFGTAGRRVAYFAYEKGRELLVIDGIEVDQGPAKWKAFPHIIFSPDGQHIAYAKPGHPKWEMVEDGVITGEYHTMTDPRFSPDSRHIAYAAALGRRWRVVVDGVEGKVYDAIVGLKFESDNRLSYIAVEDRSIFRVEHQLDIADASP